MTVNNDPNAPTQFIQSLAKRRQEGAAFNDKLSEIVAYCNNLQESDLPPLYAMQKIGSDSMLHFKAAMIKLFSDLYHRFFAGELYNF